MLSTALYGTIIISTDYSFSVFELCGSGVVLSYLRNMTESCRDHTATILKRNMADLIAISLGVINGMEYLMHKKVGEYFSHDQLHMLHKATCIIILK